MITTRPFGRTGHFSSRAIFGGAALRNETLPRTEETLLRLQSYGINHIDTAAGYGASELLLGAALPKVGTRFFIASKTAQRTRDGVEAELHRSLERLRIGCIDLMQLHSIGDPLDWMIAFGTNGALGALIRARENGLVRSLGVTAHGDRALNAILRSLAIYDFDSVMFPYNYMVAHDATQRAALSTLLTVCRDRNVAMQAIKVIAQGPWPAERVTRPTWYQPLQRFEEIDLAVRWAVATQPDVFLCTASDIELLGPMCDAIAAAPSEPDVGALETAMSRLDLRSPFS